MSRYVLIRRLRGPAFLLLIGVLALLSQAHVLSWGHSWPLFLILAGVLTLAERAALASEAGPLGPPPGPGYPYGPTPPGAYPPGTYPPGNWQGAAGTASPSPATQRNPDASGPPVSSTAIVPSYGSGSSQIVVAGEADANNDRPDTDKQGGWK